MKGQPRGWVRKKRGANARADERYRWVLVNGEVTIEDDQQTNKYSVMLLRGGKVSAQ